MFSHWRNMCSTHYSSYMQLRTQRLLLPSAVQAQTAPLVRYRQSLFCLWCLIILDYNYSSSNYLDWVDVVDKMWLKCIQEHLIEGKIETWMLGQTQVAPSSKHRNSMQLSISGTDYQTAIADQTLNKLYPAVILLDTESSPTQVITPTLCFSGHPTLL